MIIDSHVHVWSSDVREFPWAPILAHVPPPTLAAPIERLIADMDRAGVGRAVLVQPSVYGWDNRYLERCLEAWPERFIGIGLIDPRSPFPEDDLARLRDRGCRGTRLNIIRQGDVSWLTKPGGRPLFEALETLGLSVSFHMDIEHAPVVASLAARYPATSFIVDYMGPSVLARNDLDTHFDGLVRQPNVFIKLLCVAEDAATLYPFSDVTAFYRSVLDRFGAGRVMFGSDYPGAATVSSYDDIVAWGSDFPGMTAAARAMVMGGTAARIFGIQA